MNLAMNTILGLQNQITLAEHYSLLVDKDEIIDVRSEDFEGDRRYREVKNQRHDALAAEYLSFMACIDPKAIPQSLLPLRASRTRQIAAIGTLSAYSFISRWPVEASDCGEERPLIPESRILFHLKVIVCGLGYL
jgi:hypothetical protein